MVKKFLAVLLCAVMVFGSVAAGGNGIAELLGVASVKASAEDELTEGIYTYTVNGGEATIIDCDYDVSGAVTIPSTLGGYPVTCIGNSAFRGHESITNITIPDGVTTIDVEAFSWCEGLTNVIIPESVTSIGDNAFAWCESLPNIGIPGSVTSIGGYAFAECKKLESITIPDGVITIGERAFSDCTNLTNAIIPESVFSIGQEAFINTNLTEITVDPNNHNYASDDFGALFDKWESELIQYPTGNARTSYTIPDNVLIIDSFAFYNCASLENVTIPEGVSIIGEYAFCACDSLKDVYYSGTLADRKNIDIGGDNTPLLKAIWHYDSIFDTIISFFYSVYYSIVYWISSIKNR